MMDRDLPVRHDPERHDPDVCAEIERWWRATKPFCNEQTASLGREEYEMFYARLVFAFNHDDDEQNDLDPKQVLEALEVDWAPARPLMRKGKGGPLGS